MSSAPADFLPLQRTSKILTRALTMNYIKAHKYRDWFLAVAWAMSEAGHLVQARMFAKLYLFCRDYIPEGLVGEKLSFISGDNIMHHLLCHNEFSMSKHKLAKDATAAFAELEKWMSRGKGWEEALSRAKEEEDREVGLAEQAGTARRRLAWRAPGLQWPAGLLALYIIGHPGCKFRDTIARLDVQWMMAPRETLDVRDGFWKGINAANLNKVFLPAPERTAEVTLLLDYTRIFGPGFLSGRQDLRPLLPHPWNELRLEREPSPVDEDRRPGSSAERVRPDPVARLRRHLLPSGMRSPAQLREWLTDQVSQEGSDLLATWCEDWAGRLESAENYQQQLLIQSLFTQSLGRLEGLDTEDTISVEAYILLDMADGAPRMQDEGSVPEDVLRDLKISTAYAAYTGTCEQLARLVDNAHRSLYRQISDYQACFFHSLLKHKSLGDYFKEVVNFDRLRLEVIIQYSELSTPSHRPDSTDNGAALPAGSDQGRLMEQHNIDNLKLTRWQLRMLLAGADVGDVLTQRQYGIFRQESDPDGMHFIDLSRALPVTLRNTLDTTLDDNTSEKSGKTFEAIDELFRDLSQDPAEPSRRESSNSTVPSSGYSPQTPASTRSSGTTQPSATKPSQAVPRTSPIRRSIRHTPAQNHSPRLVTPTQPTRDKDARSIPDEFTKAWSIFAGKVAPAKRGSTSDGRTPKRPRLETPGKQELQEELKALKEQLKTEVLNEIAADMAVVKTTCAGALGKQQLQEELKALKGQLKTEVLNEIAADMAVVKTTCAGVKDLASRVTETKTAVIQQLDSMKNSCSSASIGKAVKKEVNDANDALMKEFRKVAESFTKEPAAGADGYLTRHCPAVEGWEGDQRTYESMLLRAGWYYITLFGIPDEGVSADENAMKDTMERYPDLPVHHVLTAIEHVHYQGYCRAFDKE